MSQACSSQSRSTLFLKRLFVAIFLSFAGFYVVSCKEEKPECRQNTDCSSPQVCTEGSCRPAKPAACQSGNSCPQGARCLQGFCLPLAPCKTKADCPSSEECTALGCEEKVSPACTKDGDCPASQTCSKGICIPATPACTKDGDCPASQTCSKGICIPATPACTKDSDCEAGTRCDQGSCVRSDLNCKEDSHCKAGQICSAGACQASGICPENDSARAPLVRFPGTHTGLFVLQGGAEILDIRRGLLRLRDAVTGEWKRWWIFPDEFGSRAQAVSPSGRWFVSPTSQGIHLWDLESENPPQPLLGNFHAAHLTDQTLSVIDFTHGRDRGLRIYSIPDLMLQKEVPFPADFPIQALGATFDSKGTTFAFFTREEGNSRLTLVESETMKILHVFKYPEYPSLMGFSPAGRYFWAILGPNSPSSVWDLQSPASPPVLLDFELDINYRDRIAIHPQETHLVTSSHDGTLRWFSLPGVSETKKVSLAITEGVTFLRYAPDGQRLFLGTENETFYVLDTDGTIQPGIAKRKSSPMSMAFSLADPSLVRSTTEDGLLRESDWVSRNAEKTRILLIPNGGKNPKNRSLLLSPDGRHLLDFFSKETSPGQSVEVIEQWELEPSLRKLRDLQTGSTYGPRVFSPDGRFFASLLQDRKIAIWDLQSNVILPYLDAASVMPTPNHEPIQTLAISPGASYLVASNAKGLAALWNREDKSFRPLQGSTKGHLGNVVFAPDGETFAAFTGSDRIDIFSSKTGAIQRSIEGITATPTVLTYTPNGAFLAADNGAGQIVVWGVKTGKVALSINLGKDAAKNPNVASYLIFSPFSRSTLYATHNDLAFSVWSCP